ncbi:McrC family protein [Hymenobacter sp. J193]|uniref:McrC family protein n=1 Tax=Hymenobacter sp. J193 TaxID=2898429 RepID=UPI002150C726|nr:McrC family protein [Hymenobacter sp. J193]MCR5886674.1 McrC family protein [Hymenobacter sp. J193]
MSQPGPFCLTSYEHETLPFSRYPELLPSHLDALERLQLQQKANWFTRLHGSLHLNQFVGVIQVPGLLLEILPKTDDTRRTNSPEFDTHWRQVLLQMLAYVHDLSVAVPDAAQLAHSPHAMLDLFVAALIEQADSLLRQGLVKHYHTTDGNRSALKGRLLFQQHITHNLTHGERFFTRHQTYDYAHPLNSLIRMALELATEQVHSPALAARTRALLLHWPELSPVPVPADSPPLNRKTERYHKALELALLLLRGHSPTLRSGRTEAVALLFDMNTLFERYVARHLQRAAAKRQGHVQLQNTRVFWPGISIRPDLVLTLITGVKPAEISHTFILDTKWKLPMNYRPSSDDMQQIFAYCHLWKASHGVLLYPRAGKPPSEIRHRYSVSHWAPDVPIEGHAYFARVLGNGAVLNDNLGKEIIEYLEKSLV